MTVDRVEAIAVITRPHEAMPVIVKGVFVSNEK